jgi:SAM-dependent methyltransferase
MSEMWDSVSQAWETNADFVDGHLADATLRMLDLAGVAEGGDVIELACGPGGAGLAAAARVGPTGSVVFADDAPGMVAVAGRRSAGLDNTSTLLCGQEEIPLADGTFDAVVIRHGLMFVEDHAAAVAEAARVLKPGGRYAAMTWGPRAENPWLGLTLDAVGDEFGTTFPPPGAPSPFALDDSDALGEILEAGGLAEVKVESVSAPLSVESVETWWNVVLQLAGPLAIAYQGMEPEVRESIRKRALEYGEAAAESTPEGITLDATVLIASGRRA